MLQIRTKPKGFETTDGTEFIPIGAHYLRRGENGSGFLTFTPKHYDKENIANTAEEFKAYGLNVVRIFAGVGNSQLTIDLHTFSPDYLRNVADFVMQMGARGVRTIIELSGSSELLNYAHYRHTLPDVDGENDQLLNISSIKARQEYAQDFLEGLQRIAPEIESNIFSVEIRNELVGSTADKPFSSISGEFEFGGTKKRYDLSKPSERRLLMADGVLYFAEQITQAVRSVMPHVMVSCSTLPPNSYGRGGYDDNLPNPDKGVGLAIDPSVLAASAFSYVDVHRWNYPSAADNISMNWDKAVQECVRFGKGILAGEFGTYRQSAAVPIDDDLKAGARLEDFWNSIRGSTAGFVLFSFQHHPWKGYWGAKSSTSRILEWMAKVANKSPVVPDAPYYFFHNGTGWYTDGFSSRAFASPEWMRLHQMATGAISRGETSNLVGPNLGRSPLPRGRFIWKGTQYFSEGNGDFYSITAADFPKHTGLHAECKVLGRLPEDDGPYQNPMRDVSPWNGLH